jgi:hypothetical protein
MRSALSLEGVPEQMHVQRITQYAQHAKISY